jgi:hypothetical protein
MPLVRHMLRRRFFVRGNLMKRLIMTTALSLSFSASAALAVSDAVKNACRDDYHKHCDKLEVGSEELRACMKSKATELSHGCLQALVDNKEVTEKDVEDYLKEQEAKKAAAQ